MRHDTCPDLAPLAALLGEWATEATHPMLPRTIEGHAAFEWLEGGRFLLYRAHADHSERDAVGFSQRFRGSFSDGGNTIASLWELSRDGSIWDDDLAITYRRAE